MAQMSKKSIGLEVATVTLQADQLGMLPEIFSRLDEQVLAPESRQLLSLNGIRAGVLGVQLPESVNLLLIEAADRRRHPTAETQPIEDDLRFVQCREKKGADAKLWGIRDVAAKFNDGEVAATETLSQAECLMRLFGVPQGGAGATIRVIPEIEFGPLRQKYVVQDNAFHMEAKRDQRSYEDLEMEIPLRSGEVMMVTCNPASEDSLGRAFFFDHSQQSQKLLLVRLVQTQIDDLFESE